MMIINTGNHHISYLGPSQPQLDCDDCDDDEKENDDHQHLSYLDLPKQKSECDDALDIYCFKL